MTINETYAMFIKMFKFNVKLKFVNENRKKLIININ